MNLHRSIHLQKFCLKNECIKTMVEIQKLKEWNKKKKKLVEDLKTANDYLKIAQQVFNKFIRVRDNWTKLYLVQQTL
jgi:Cu/Ag efflux pump CusA